jgi:hypothetical protein
MGQVMRRTRFSKHPYDDPEKAAQFGYSFEFRATVRSRIHTSREPLQSVALRGAQRGQRPIQRPNCRHRPKSGKTDTRLMPRPARVVAVGVPHPITHRGNNRQDGFQAPISPREGAGPRASARGSVMKLLTDSDTAYRF